MNSIAARLTVGAGIVLTAFVLFTAIALQQSVEKRARAAQFDKLQGLIYGLLGATDIDSSGRLLVNEGELPDAKLGQPGSPLVAQVTQGVQRTIWRSASLMFDLPVAVPSAIGEWAFERALLDAGRSFFILRFTVEWEGESPTNPRYTFTVAQDTASFDRLIDKFDTNLWSLLLIASALLLVVLYLVLRWSLSPLQHVTRAVGDVECGKRRQLPQNVPRELEPLATGLNELLRSEHSRQNRYKNALDDLAHSLKTPLSVIRNLAGDANISARQRDEFNAQVQRMDEIVARHLHSSSIANRSPLARRINLHTLVSRLGNSLDKVYRDKRIAFEYHIDKSLSARLNEGDAMEIIGNLMENACKYCRSTVRVEFSCTDKTLTMLVEDDGPGFPQDMSTLTERGIRADTQNDGQGIGLAIVAELVNLNAGSINLGVSTLGGGRVEISLPIT